MQLKLATILAVALTLALAASASAGVRIQRMGGVGDTTGITADDHGNVYVLGEFLKLVRLAPDGTSTVVPWTAPYDVQNMPKSTSPVWGPDRKIWFSCRPRICHVDPDGGGLIDTPAVYGTPGPDGNFWNVDATTGTISRTVLGGITTSFPVLPALPLGRYPSVLASGLGDALWFTYGASLVRVTMAGAVTSFPLPDDLQPGFALAAGPDGNLWASTSNAVARISPTGQVLGRYPVAETPTALAAGPDGDVWFTYFGAAGIGRITPSGHVSDFAAEIQEMSNPSQIVRASDGGMWVNALRSPMTWRIDPDPPVVTTEAPSGVSVDGSMLRATVDPEGGPTSVSFEYGTTTAYGARTSEQDVGDGEGAVLAAAGVTALQPATTYHYRAVAVNGMRTVRGADRTLTTASVPQPPDRQQQPDHGDPSASDADGDGYPAGVDCDDQAASVHPGGVDKPGDAIDQDCASGPRPWGHLAPPVDVGWLTRGRSTRFTRLVLGALPVKATLTLSCRGAGCSFQRYKLRTRRATKSTNLLVALKRSELRRGATVELRLAASGQATTVIRWRIGPPTRRVTRCLAPGARKEIPCS